MAKDHETHRRICSLIVEARHSIDSGDYEDTAMKLNQCLQLEADPKGKAAILDDLGYCFLRLGWFEEAAKVYTEYLNILPFDNDARFFLASAYASLGWKWDAIKELRTILASDTNDVLARHDLALCYRNMGWMKESLEEMKIANANAMICGNVDENEVVKSSLAQLEHEIENGDDGGIKEALLFFALLITIIKRSSKTILPHLCKYRR